MSAPTTGARRGVVLMATFVVIVIAAITAGAIVQTTTVQRMGLAASGARAQSRALAWSGVLAAMNELESQRESLLRGADPQLTEEWTVFEQQGGGRAIVRLRLFGESAAIAESARLDLNSAAPEMIAALAGVGDEAAQRIVAARSEALFASVAEALVAASLDQPAAAARDHTGAQDPSSPSVAGVRDLVTVFSADPAVQAGIGPEGGGAAGEACVSVREPWDEQVRRSLERRFEPAILNSLQPPSQEGEPSSSPDSPAASGQAPPARREPPATTAELITRLSAAGLSPEKLPEALDTLVVTEDEFRFGRIDIMRAPQQVLACVPGLSEEAAAAIVERRGSIDEEARLSPAWLLAEGLLTEEQFRQAVDHITTRSLQWRITVEAGIADASGDLAPLEQPDLRHRVSLEAVIDLAGERPRIAYLRDVTLLDAAEAVASLRELEQESAALVQRPDEDAPPDSPSAPSEADTGDEDGGLALDGLRLRELSPSPAASRSLTAPPDPSATEENANKEPSPTARNRIGRWTSR